MKGEIPLAAFADGLTSSKHGASDSPGALTPEALVNGHATSVVYSLLTRTDRRKHGIFFSGTDWARLLVAHSEAGRWQRYLDPSAGTGDLLVEVCRCLPLEANIEATLDAWTARLAAIDLRPSFLQIAWIRIQSLAAIRHAERGERGLSPLRPKLPNDFRSGDVLTSHLSLRSGDCVVMNPPYHAQTAPKHSFVGQGKRSAAALHIESILRRAPPGVGIVALIPDVLRSGTSYKRFRREISERMDVASFEGHGSFGGHADVDVAILVGTTREHNDRAESALQPRPIKRAVVGERFSVRVGPVVPHRTLETGERLGYLTTKNAPLWGRVKSCTQHARFAARTECGPFVAIRRTSSPSEKERARATLISSREKILVENHLIVCKPLGGTLRECQALMLVLRDPQTSEWLNRRIRCRHLTVQSISELPWLGHLED